MGKRARKKKVGRERKVNNKIKKGRRTGNIGKKGRGLEKKTKIKGKEVTRNKEKGRKEERKKEVKKEFPLGWPRNLGYTLVGILAKGMSGVSSGA